METFLSETKNKEWLNFPFKSFLQHAEPIKDFINNLQSFVWNSQSIHCLFTAIEDFRRVTNE